MDNVPKNKSEKIKKTPPTSAKENNENVKNEKKVEGNKGNSKEQLHSERLHSYPFVPPTSESGSETETLENLDLELSKEERRREILKLKWATVTGKKPACIPITKRYKRVDEEDSRKFSFFGDRRPAEMERRRKENWMKLKRLDQTEILFENEAEVSVEIRFPSVFGGLRCLKFFSNGESLVTGFRNGIIQVRCRKKAR